MIFVYFGDYSLINLISLVLHVLLWRVANYSSFSFLNIKQLTWGEDFA